MDYAALRAADTALPGSPLPLAEAAAALNAQTITLENQDTVILDMHNILMASATADWAHIVLRSRAVPTNAPSDAAIMAAITATALASAAVAGGTTAVRTSDPAIAAQLDAMLAGLRAAGDVSAASAAAIVALRIVTRTAWQPVVTTGDVQTARGQP